MKKKVGELYNKPIVIGNKNEVTKNEVALSDLKGGNENEKYLYFSVDYDNHNIFFNLGGFVLLRSQLFKILDIDDSIYINTGDIITSIEAGDVKLKAVALDSTLKIDTKTTNIERIKDTLKHNNNISSITDIPGVASITEEEFYTI